jgi:hypothetical protein
MYGLGSIYTFFGRILYVDVRPTSPRRYVFLFWNMLCFTSVNGFFGIGAFCGIRGRLLNIRRAFSLWLEVFFYNCFGWTVNWLYGRGFVYSEVKFPLASGWNWFPKVYFKFLMIQPGINIFAQSLSKIEYIYLCISILVYRALNFKFWNFWLWPMTWQEKYGLCLAYMCSIYIIIGYFGLHGNPLPNAMTFLAMWFCYYVGVRTCSGNPLWQLGKSRLWLQIALLSIRDRTSVLVTIIATLRILCFSVLAIDAKSCVGKCILFLAGKSFAILLFHIHMCINDLLFSQWLLIDSVIGSGMDVKYMWSFKNVCLVSLFSVAMDGFRVFFSDIVMLIIDKVVMCMKRLKQWCELKWKRRSILMDRVIGFYRCKK